MSSPIQKEHLPTHMITVFDLKCNDNAHHTVSPWGRVVINAMRFKNIPFHLEYVEMIDAPALCKMLGNDNTSQNTDPFYTLPAMYDPRTSTLLADSLHIVQYLDKRFPNSPVLLPRGTAGLVAAFLSACRPIDEAAFLFILPNMLRLLEGTRSESHFRRSRMMAIRRRPIDEIAPTGEEAVKIWLKIKMLLDGVDSWYGDQVFIMGGHNPTYADLSMAGRLWWYRSSLGPESQEWMNIASWHGGRWGKLIAYFDSYSD